MKRNETPITYEEQFYKFRKSIAEAIQSLRSTRLTYDQSAQLNKIYKAVFELIEMEKKYDHIKRNEEIFLE